MQTLGLLGLLITIALAGWWLMSTGPVAPANTNPDDPAGAVGYEEVLDSAREAAGNLGGGTTGAAKQVEVYTGISVQANVTTLDLSGRGLTGSLKAEIRHLTNLKTLNLSNNEFTGLPAEVGQLSKLEVLDLSNNPFTGLPYELGNLKNLKTLDLRGTQYAKQDLDVIKKTLPDSVKILVD